MKSPTLRAELMSGFAIKSTAPAFMASNTALFTELTTTTGMGY